MVATFWQAVGWIAGLLVLVLVLGLLAWRRRHRAAGLRAGNPAPATPPKPRKPNGEDRTF